MKKFDLIFFFFAAKLFDLSLADNKQILCDVKIWNEVCVIHEKEIDSMGFSILPASNDTKSLNMEDNKKIFFLPTSLDQTFPNLQMIDASECSIKEIHNENFKNLNKLDYLNLAGNQIKTIAANTFEDLVSLRKLDLSYNPIRMMSGRVFMHLKKLELVILDHTECIDESFGGYYADRIKNLVQEVDRHCGPSSKLNVDCSETLSARGHFIGGDEVKQGQWPFKAVLQYREPRGGEKSFCGVNLVTTRHVLTAAHCIQKKGTPRKLNATEFIVCLGCFDLKATNEINSVERNVSRIDVHPSWDYLSVRFDADIAILLLVQPVQFSNTIKPICLPVDTDIENILAGVVVGWDKSEDKNLAKHVPRKVSLNAVGNTQCFRNDHIMVKLSSTRTFCAGGENITPCAGDSGSGFYVESNNFWTLKGIVSASIRNHRGECSTALCTNVLNFTSWINETVEKDRETF